jgi:hypothetical protein
VKKIVSLFQRNYDGDRLVRNEVVPGAEWVLLGEGVATRKYDGTCCLIRGGRLYKRFEVKAGGKAPGDFEPATDVDEVTGKQQGWVPVGDGPDDCWHREAFAAIAVELVDGATAELCGPKVQGNPEKLAKHTLIFHSSAERLPDCPRDFDGLKAYLASKDIEGIVWHHSDGRMVKVKKRDFGLKR